jgi:hypothetical protein
MSIDPGELERELCRIPEVHAARVLLNGAGSPSEARILAGPERSPKRVRRDVQSVASTSFGVELAGSAIHVTQLERSAVPHTPAGLAGVRGLESVFDPPGTLAGEREGGPGDTEGGPDAEGGPDTEGGPDEPEGTVGAELLEVSVRTDGSTTSFEVSLRGGGRHGSARTEGTTSERVALRRLGEATLRAAAPLSPAAGYLHLEAISLVPAGDALVALACTTDPRGEAATGSAPVGAAGSHHAAARAVLAAAGIELFA